MSKLRENLIKEMKLRGWTPTEMERRSGVPQSTTQRFVSGKTREPKDRIVKKWAKALGKCELTLRGVNPALVFENIAIDEIKNTVVSNYLYVSSDNFDKLSDKNHEEFIEMIVDTDKVPPPPSNALIVGIGTNRKFKGFSPGERVLFDKQRKPKPGEIILLTFLKNNHTTLAKYLPTPNAILLMILEEGYPETIQVIDSDFFIHGVAFSSSITKLLIL